MSRVINRAEVRAEPELKPYALRLGELRVCLRDSDFKGSLSSGLMAEPR